MTTWILLEMDEHGIFQVVGTTPHEEIADEFTEQDEREDRRVVASD